MWKRNSYKKYEKRRDKIKKLKHDLKFDCIRRLINNLFKIIFKKAIYIFSKYFSQV